MSTKFHLLYYNTYNSNSMRESWSSTIADCDRRNFHFYMYTYVHSAKVDYALYSFARNLFILFSPDNTITVLQTSRLCVCFFNCNILMVMKGISFDFELYCSRPLENKIVVSLSYKFCYSSQTAVGI